ncbi:hypothetical protein Rs2_05498 [Raphanus sativus]|nr:hypothetical protein Rs2_05498 [Raphanus sativus]
MDLASSSSQGNGFSSSSSSRRDRELKESNLVGNSGVVKMGEGMRKRLKISVPPFDNSELIKTYAKTLIGRCMNPPAQDMKALLLNLPKIWKVEDRVVGTDLGLGKFQFDFQTEEDIQSVMMLQPFHFDYWMLAVARWQPKKSQAFPSEITFWVRVLGVPMAFRTAVTMQSIGDAIGTTVALDVKHSRVQVIVDGFSPLCFETTMDFKGGEFYDGEEVAVSLRYEKLFGYCKGCGSLCHKEEICPLKTPAPLKETAKLPEQEIDNGGWIDGGKHDERARSYRGVVLNGSGNQQGNGREKRDYYGKGKGKMEERTDSKWVRRSDKSHKKHYQSRGNYNGEGSSTRSRQTRQEETGTDIQKIQELVDPRRSETAPMEVIGEAEEEGEFRPLQERSGDLPSAEFQMALLETQADGDKVIVEGSYVEHDLLQHTEQHVEQGEEELMDMEAIKASLLENGIDMDGDDILNELTDEEAEKELMGRVEGLQVQADDFNTNREEEKGKEAKEVAKKTGTRKKLFKGNISIAGSTKLRNASALVSPRKKAAGKTGARHGDTSKQGESKGGATSKAE